MNNLQDTYIYESPDGGHTVYRRPIGGVVIERELVSISDAKLQEQELNALWLQWIPILRASKNDNDLRELIERAEIYYHLKSQP